MSDATIPPLLRLWLPGYHTPSLNRTKGHHWSRYRKLKQAAAGALLGGLRDAAPMKLNAAQVRFAFARLADIALGKKSAAKVSRGLPSSDSAGLGPVHLTFTRVTCAPLDAENFAGGTKALTDCLVAAFPQWLPDDSLEHVIHHHEQVRCGAKDEQGTWVVLRNDEMMSTPPKEE